MIAVGTEVVNKATGHSLKFRDTASSSDGELVRVTSTYTGPTPPPPSHFHPLQEERFRCLSGSARARVGSDELHLVTGDDLVIPPRTPHQIWCEADSGGVLLWETRPAMRTDQLLVALWNASSSKGAGADGSPALMDAIPLLNEFRHEFVLAKPPLMIQRCVFPALSMWARAIHRRP